MKTNQELLAEANKIEFKVRSNGALEGRSHSLQERGLYFIKNALLVHGMYKYQYGLVLDHYVDNRTKVPVLCYKHGEFLVTPDNHVSKASGCAKCSNHLQSTEEWIEKARKVHGNKYDYCSTNYKGTAQKVAIICSEHGTFLQEAGSHLKGFGCAKCSNKHQHSTSEWIKLAKKIQGNRYDYSKVIYLHNKSKVEIVCPEHGSFWQIPTDHINNFHGCPRCKGKNHNIIYLLRCKDTGLFKIGITTDNVGKRISGIGGNIEEVLHVVCKSPREHEAYLHKLYKDFNVYHEGVRSGNTEFFSLNEEQKAQVRQYMASIAINQKSI